MTTFEKLQIRIADELGIYLYDFRRTRSGYWDRLRGAWSWRAKNMKISENHLDYGSQYSATDLLKCKRIEISKTSYSIEFTPEE